MEIPPLVHHAITLGQTSTQEDDHCSVKGKSPDLYRANVQWKSKSLCVNSNSK